MISLKRQSKKTKEQISMANFEKKHFRNTKYLIYYPKNFDPKKKYPLFFHLHGAGSRGNDFKEFEGSTILAMLNRGDTPLSEAVCVFPQCHDDTWFDEFNELLDLVEETVKLPFVDKKRATGSGISMGGYAMYQVLMCKPELFNKAFICCGGGMYWNNGRLKNIKFRIFHGEKDTAVYPEESKRMYARLLEAGADVKLTLYEDLDHNCWDASYTNLDNLKWIVE